jgi:hypothetical protein
MLLGDSGISMQKASLPEQKTKMFVEPAAETPELPEPPVVVYVKEVGKAGI